LNEVLVLLVSSFFLTGIKRMTTVYLMRHERGGKRRREALHGHIDVDITETVCSRCAALPG
jgi:hypothetical protein